ncbi:MAG: arginyltransferase [Alphaproteobacteria bacterium]|nr:arginyltransferase [Alphaproteobacteria bacterium]
MFLGNSGLGLPIVFYRTAPMPCPYLGDKIERRLIADLGKPATKQAYSTLAVAGFRRSQNMIYRPACPNCNACQPVRIVVDGFKPSKSQRRILNRNAHLSAREVENNATWEQYRLFSAYQSRRHSGGEMSFMTFDDYRDMIEISPIATWMIEYRDPDGVLAACMLVDDQSDGLSAVYSFFDPELETDGLGTLMVLDMVEQTRKAGLPYLYLGFFVQGSRKMSYKRRFKPLEALGQDGWQPI